MLVFQLAQSTADEINKNKYMHTVSGKNDLTPSQSCMQIKLFDGSYAFKAGNKTFKQSLLEQDNWQILYGVR